MTEYRVQLTLSPMPRMKAKGLVVNLFGKYGIDDENDIHGVDYIISEDPKLIGKCIIKFIRENDAESFTKQCEEEDNTNILSVKIIPCGEPSSLSENEDDDTLDSVSIVADRINNKLSPKRRIDNHLSLTPDQNQRQHKAINNNMFKSCIVTDNEKKASVEEAERKQQQKNNRVEFSITPAIRNSDDQELILLLIQNKARSGGGEIETNYRVNDAKTSIIVIYIDNESKKRVIAKHEIKFRDYVIIANEPFDETNFEINKYILILRNIDPLKDVNNTLVCLYAENLVPNNVIESVATSKLFKNTHYIKFKNEFDFILAQERHKRRPSIKQMDTEILEAFNTNSIIGVLENYNSLNHEIIDLYFTNKNRSGVDKYLMTKEYKPFTLIQFYNQEQVETVLSRKHVFNKQDFIMEKYYNSKLLDLHFTSKKDDKPLINKNSRIFEKNENISRSLELISNKNGDLEKDKLSKPNEGKIINKSPEKDSSKILKELNNNLGFKRQSSNIEASNRKTPTDYDSIEELKKKQSLIQKEHFDDDDYVVVNKDVSDAHTNNVLIDEFKYKLDPLAEINILFTNCDKVLSDFNKLLKSSNLSLVKIEEYNKIIFEFKYLNPNLPNSQSYEQFKKFCEQKLNEFIKRFEVSFNVIDIPEELYIFEMNLDRMCEQIYKNYDEVYLSVNDKFIQFSGYKIHYNAVFRKLNDEFANILAGKKHSIRNPPKINQNKTFRLAMESRDQPNIKIFYFFEDEFKKLIETLKKYNTNCIKNSELESFFIELVSKNNDTNESEWAKNMISIVQDSLKPYQIRQIEINKKLVKIADLQAANQNVLIEPIEENLIEIYGKLNDVSALCSEIKRLQEQKPASVPVPTPAPTATPVPVTSPTTAPSPAPVLTEFKPEISNLTLPEIRVFYAIKYQSEMEKKYKGLKIKIDSKNSKIKYECDDRKTIEEAIVRANEIKSKIQNQQFNCEKIQIEFMRSNENEIVKWLKDKNLLAVFDIQYSFEAFRIYATDANEIQRCHNELVNDLQIKKVPMNKTNQDKINAFVTDECTSLIWAGDKRPTGYIAKIVGDKESRVYTICGFKKECEGILKRLSTCLNTNI